MLIEIVDHNPLVMSVETLAGRAGPFVISVDRDFVRDLTHQEIEAAIEKLPPSAVEELARWLEAFRARCEPPQRVDDWLERSRGAARAGTTTAEVMALTRGVE